MLLFFGSMHDEHRARKSLDNLHQSGSLQTYVQEFQKLTAQVVDMPCSEGEKVHRFLKGLREPLKSMCLFIPGTVEPVTSLQDAISQAVHRDAVLSAHVPNDELGSVAVRQGPRGTLRSCSPDRRPNKRQKGRQQDKRPHAFRCGEKGAPPPGLR